MTRHVLAITGSRAEFGIMQSLLAALREAPDFRLSLVVTGGHLVESLGQTWREIEQAGFDIARKIPMAASDGSRASMAETVGQGTAELARAIVEIAPDWVLLVGDRYETFAAAAASYLVHVPVVHLHGGEITRGAIDDALRHAITKLSHVHFASTAEYAARIRQLGEEPWRVHVVGAPGLDAAAEAELLPAGLLAERIGFDPAAEPPAILTYHPATLASEPPGATFALLADALAERHLPVVITGPNTDPGSGAILDEIHRFVQRYPRAVHRPSLGHLGYLSLLNAACCMVGNSSSGIIEAASFKLPVLNVGRRQDGRARGKNVIDAEADGAGIAAGLEKVLDPAFAESLSDLVNPYGEGQAWPKMLAALRQLPDRQTLLVKGFVDTPGGRR